MDDLKRRLELLLGAKPEAPVREQLASALDTDSTGRPVLTLTLPDKSALDDIARLLGGLLARVTSTPSILN